MTLLISLAPLPACMTVPLHITLLTPVFVLLTVVINFVPVLNTATVRAPAIVSIPIPTIPTAIPIIPNIAILPAILPATFTLTQNLSILVLVLALQC